MVAVFECSNRSFGGWAELRVRHPQSSYSKLFPDQPPNQTSTSCLIRKGLLLSSFKSIEGSTFTIEDFTAGAIIPAAQPCVARLICFIPMTSDCSTFVDIWQQIHLWLREHLLPVNQLVRCDYSPGISSAHAAYGIVAESQCTTLACSIMASDLRGTRGAGCSGGSATAAASSSAGCVPCLKAGGCGERVVGTAARCRSRC